MADSFSQVLAFTLQWEGGYVNNSADPGGATNKGITHSTYDRYRARKGLPPADVRDITDAEVEDIYRASYWDAASCAALAWPLCAAHFDAAVNTGPRQAAKFLQRALGVPDDGVIGQLTLAAAATALPAPTAALYCDKRQAFYDALVSANPALAPFGKGWGRRVAAMRELCGQGGVVRSLGDIRHAFPPETTLSALPFIALVEARGIAL